jgi:hypothetical protein
MTVGTLERLRMLTTKVEVTMDEVVLEESNEKCEFILGCYLQSNFKWHEQVDNLVKKLKKRLVGLSSLKYVVPFHTRNTNYFGIKLPKLLPTPHQCLREYPCTTGSL